MRKKDKIVVIKQIATIIGEYLNFYLVDVAMLNASITSSLRRECNKQGIKLVVVKNTLLKRAWERMEEDFSILDAALKGNTAIMFSNSANRPARLIKTFSEGMGVLKLKAAYVQEEFYLGSENLDLLVSVKSKDELVGDVITLLQSSAKKIVLTLDFGRQTIHRILKTFLKKKEMAREDFGL
ncbi:50S ribosomal protein L10 [Candidatus Azobacteroides pseudotrichonymphae]|uniref:Large ribosomal subunit protein uL10 n=1 Tax=Azobacteroides pseudotrichonymphae genomovar. CFP2 TaxID=511995 RepID=B6YPZ9_AZOPC|nr:50S ribosomal protein L10 [Candidatus Azobacteroides pseudotrichonymphae]BAG83271.1 50S ribosomal protein L10 [Candidatus Azobacteroides pseudotrichonymphae genomovar. CFP2]